MFNGLLPIGLYFIPIEKGAIDSVQIGQIEFILDEVDGGVMFGDCGIVDRDKVGR